MIFIIDGTGPANHTQYAREMSNGFCMRLNRKAKGRYWRGPKMDGMKTTALADTVTEAVVRWKSRKEPDSRLFLAGYSRGGAAVIWVAQGLKKRGMEVDAMFLFDAVDRTFNNFRSSEHIPGNVLHCYHAVRDGSLASYYSDGVQAARDKVAACVGLPRSPRSGAMESAIDSILASRAKPGDCAEEIRKAQDIIQQDNKMKIVMRSTTMLSADGGSVNFGNCGLAAEGQCRLTKESFLGSHGALGGAPYTDDHAPRLLIEADRAAMVSVDAWMSAHLCKHGVFEGGRIRD